MEAIIWKHQEITVTLTTWAPGSHYGFPVLRVEGHPAGDADLAPASLIPALPGEAWGFAADLLCAIHRKKPLTGEALERARAFLRQWPDGPQIQ